MYNLIHEPSEYVSKYRHILTIGSLNEAIENDNLPVGMSIDYALEVISILEKEG
tara:strand:- start:343 stop:504 length:162 start_codon:yes stop_codon:yes gene_type:complete